jgi:hypothetical protein
VPAGGLPWIASWTGTDWSTIWKVSLCGLAENLLQALRILQARNLDEDAVGALALDDRFGGPEFVRRDGRGLRSTA